MGNRFVKKYTDEEIGMKLNKRELILLEGEYQTCNSPIIVEDKEGYKYFTTIENIMKEGKLFKFNKSNPYTIDNIKIYLNNNFEDIILLSDSYNGSTNELVFKCVKHDLVFKKSLKKLKGCPKCTGSYVYSIEEVSDMVKKITPNILILGECRNKYNNRLFRCKCIIDGDTWEASFSDLITFKHGCLKCSYRNKIGEGNPNYNPNKTEEERETKRDYTEYYYWRQKVYERDNYTCICCGYNKGKKLNAHHLNGYNWDKEHRTDVNNGVTLCKDCHDFFHNIYGYGDNVKEEFIEFYKNEFNKDLEMILP